VRDADRGRLHSICQVDNSPHISFGIHLTLKSSVGEYDGNGDENNSE